MTVFDAIGTSGSGMNTYQTWVDAIANNIANVNTVRPTSSAAFQAAYVRADANDIGAKGVGTGVHATGLSYSSAEGRLVYSPDNPIADAQGFVRLPDIDMGEQMGNLIMAQRALQANSAVIGRAKSCYQAAIDIGKGIH
jgi:flagellar basal-body rod protein FlgC